MFYTPKHAKPTTASPARRRVAGVAVAGATAAAGSVAVAPSASAGTVWDRVAACESGGNWSINTGNGFYGGLQFHPQTWRGYGGGAYAPMAHQASKAEQIAIAKKVLRSQGPGAWPVCSRKAGLTRANGLAADGGSTSSSRSTAASRSVSRAPLGSGKLVVDGQMGPRTNAKIEKWVGSRVDGKLAKRWDVHRFQRKVGLAKSQRNGWINSRAFVTKLQQKVGATQTGSWNSETVRELQKHLNWKGV